MTRVAVLGSTGMVGHTVVERLVLDGRFTVWPCPRRVIEATDETTLKRLVDVDYVINCVGIIWQAQNPNDAETSLVNTTFPWRLQQRCEDIGARLIHVSTDCVFTGKKGGYTEDDAPDELKTYGLTKFLGEPNGAMVLRTSIIGPEVKSKRSFLEWARSSADTQVKGFTNHIWNGVTSLEYARICADIMAKGLWQPEVFHLHSNALSKHDLLSLLNDRYQLNLDIVPYDDATRIDRTLASVKPLCANLAIPSIEQMVKEIE